jgi:hypothetical protein
MLLTNNGALTIDASAVNTADVVYQGGIAVRASTGAVYVSGIDVINTYTWAQLQALPSPTANTRAYVSDLGNSEWVYNGTRWTRNSPVILGQSALPIIIPSSGSVGVNGALTGIVALDFTYPACYMYFISNAVYAGQTAGYYYVVMSSTTAGTIYNNQLNPAAPSIPASPTGVVSGAIGAFTQSVAAVPTAVSVSVPANSMGPNGSVRYSMRTRAVGNASGQTIFCGFGASNSNVFALGMNLGVAMGSLITDIRNRGNTARQMTGNQFANPLVGMTGNNPATQSTVDTTAAQNATIALQINTAATDFVILESWCIELLPGA